VVLKIPASFIVSLIIITTMKGETVEDYHIIEELGQGSFGQVFRATDLILDREVAVKVLHNHLLQDSGMLQTLRADALMLAKLYHPNIAMLYDSFEYKGSYLFVKEYIKGETFRSLLKQSGPFPVRQALELFCQVLRGFEHAHSKQIIHGGIKPTNLILDSNGRVKITDFGIARLLGKSRLAGTERPIGRLQYMSPEQLLGADTDERSDIYSLGILLYEMVTGSVPFSSTSEYDLMRMQIEAKPILPRNLVTKLPESVEQAILCALEKDPDSRFQAVCEFRWALEAALAELSIDKDLLPTDAQEKWVVTSTMPDEKDVSTISQPQTVEVTRAPILYRRREILPVWATLTVVLIVALVVFLARFLTPLSKPAREAVNKPPVAAQPSEPKTVVEDIKNDTPPDDGATISDSSSHLKPQRVITRQMIRPIKRAPEPPVFRAPEPSQVLQIRKENERRIPGISQVSNRIPASPPPRDTELIKKAPPVFKPRPHPAADDEIYTGRSARLADFMNAASNGKRGDLKDLLEEGININARDAMGRTALMLAASRGHADTVKFLLERRASINARDINGKTALMRAIDGGHDDTVRTLLKRGATVDSRYSDRLTSLLR
jgi:serine/threonine protein kinase